MSARGRHLAEATEPGWWLTPGLAICPFCEQPHQFEAMLYCTQCDDIVCAVCVIVSIDRDPCCPVCHAASGES